MQRGEASEKICEKEKKYLQKGETFNTAHAGKAYASALRGYLLEKGGRGDSGPEEE